MQGLNPLTMQCIYSTPCGYCTKWDKKCDKKIGCGDSKPQRGLRAKAGIFLDDAMSPCVTYEPCPYCKFYECDNPECLTCKKENYKYFK